MSSNILPIANSPARLSRRKVRRAGQQSGATGNHGGPDPADAAGPDGRRDPFLLALGERVRELRARHGLTRKVLAQMTGVSERHLANLEYGVGNASILILVAVANALRCPVAELLGDVTTSTPEWLMLRDLLEPCDETALRRVRLAVTELLGPGGTAAGTQARRPPLVALIGLRGAGKSTLGQMLAEDLDFPFIETSREIERLAGCGIGEIQALYGQNAFRRYERRAVEEAVQIYPEAVIATAGGVVSDPGTFNLLLTHCTTVWLRATPEDHMRRVLAQGDTRPMAASTEAMQDLRTILAGRSAFYAKAELQVNTSTQDLGATFDILRALVRQTLGLPN